MTVASLDVSAVAGRHAMPAALLLAIVSQGFVKFSFWRHHDNADSYNVAAS